MGDLLNDISTYVCTGYSKVSFTVLTHLFQTWIPKPNHYSEQLVFKVSILKYPLAIKLLRRRYS